MKKEVDQDLTYREQSTGTVSGYRHFLKVGGSIEDCMIHVFIFPSACKDYLSYRSQFYKVLPADGPSGYNIKGGRCKTILMYSVRSYGVDPLTF